MSWYSILPPYLTVLETWIIRLFIFLAFINLLPWFVAICFDLVLYIARKISHEIPVHGGSPGERHAPERPVAPMAQGGAR